MDSLLDQVNSLIKMNVGEPYRLEHIKFRLKQNKSLRNSDTTYLNYLVNRYLQKVEKEKTPDIEPDSKKSSEEDLESIYCWNCGTKNKRVLKFCVNCAWEIHTVKSTKEDKTPNTISKTKIRKKLVILGLAMMVLGSTVFIVPLGESGWTINDRNVFCKSGMEINQQALLEESENCPLVSQLIIIASFLGTLGIIFVIIGLIKKKIILKN